MTKLLLHIGHPKCGSSTIQDFLEKNRLSLWEQKVGIVNHDLSILKDRQQYRPPVSYFRAHKDLTNDPKLDHKLFGKLLKAAQSQNLDTLVLSAENLANINVADQLAFLSEFFDLRVVYYIRRQDDLLVSSWKQWRMKNGHSLNATVAKHCKRKHRDSFRKIIKAYAKFVAHEDFTVNILSRDFLKNGDLLDDFASASGLSDIPYARVEDANISFNSDLTRALSHCSFLFDDMHDNRLFTFLEGAFGSSLKGVKDNPLTIAQEKKILACHKQENQWLQEHFFKDKDLLKALAPREDRTEKSGDDFKAIVQMQGIIMKMLMDSKR